MKQEEKNKDLCKTCEHNWTDFPMPLDRYVSHCDILDEKYGLIGTIMDEKVPYPCLKCPFDSYIEKK